MQQPTTLAEAEQSQQAQGPCDGSGFWNGDQFRASAGANSYWRLLSSHLKAFVCTDMGGT
jgi:hypothetical protein